MPPPTLFLLGGPTASGKSALALAIARRHNGIIINADAMQIYRGLPVLTSQPSAEDKTEIPHLLYEITPPSERSSVAAWLSKTLQALNAATSNGQTPIVVGGTGLYFKALLEGLADVPEIPDHVRAETAALLGRLGLDGFRAELARIDPESAACLKPKDKQRLIRAFEVAAHTGKPLSHWQRAKTDSPVKDYTIRPILLLPERQALYATCDARFLDMMARGAMDEVKALLALDLDPGLPAMKIIGVPELSQELKSEITHDQAVLKAQQATRNYAKRQITWFKNQWRQLEKIGIIGKKVWVDSAN